MSSVGFGYSKIIMNSKVFGMHHFEKSSNFCKNLQKNQEIYTKEFLPILTTTGTITIHIHITQVSLQIFKP